jgi:hypothetical protein
MLYTTIMLNKTFYRFLFGFLAVVASTLAVIIIVGSSQGGEL